ncbi:hypothetical protein LCGC14_1750360 [marine sediment metagenome]|uniref:Terminase small subunit n=1 Tax=marine sediment metagenome TaxID=412755 RepID=A0A0F9HRF5_9ZZZZ
MSMTERPLTNKRIHFCAEYTTNGHNASQAYKTAFPRVVSGWNAHGARLIAKDSIKQEISRIEAEYKAEYVADRQERQHFWTQTMKTAPNMNDRLRASELLGKSQCDFIDLGLTGIAEVPTPVSAEDIAEFRAMAKAATKVRLSKGA